MAEKDGIEVSKPMLLVLAGTLCGVIIGILLSGQAWSIVNAASDKSGSSNIDGWYDEKTVPYFDHGALGIDDIQEACSKANSSVKIYYRYDRADVYCYIDADNCTQGGKLAC